MAATEEDCATPAVKFVGGQVWLPITIRHVPYGLGIVPAEGLLWGATRLGPSIFRQAWSPYLQVGVNFEESVLDRHLQKTDTSFVLYRK